MPRSEIDGSPEAELGLVTRALGYRMTAETALVARWDRTEQSVEVVSSWGVDAHPHPLVVPQGPGFVGRVLASGRGIAEPLGRGDDTSLGVPASGARLTHAIGAPVQSGGRTAALCAGFSEVPPGFPDTALQIVESYARLASFCLQDPGVLDRLFENARRDELTGCLNYASSRHELVREIERSARHGLSLSCCFIDLDGFKGVNDRHGHLRANSALAQIASVLAGGVRSSDTIGRYGGDEFVAILPETDEAAACTLAERLRSRVGGETLEAVDDAVNASVGVAEWHPGFSAESVLEAADQALRAAKTAGGGVVVAESTLHPELAPDRSKRRFAIGRRTYERA